MTYLTDNRGCNLCGAPCEIVDEPGIPTHSPESLATTTRCLVDKGTATEEDKEEKDGDGDLTELMNKLALQKSSKSTNIVPSILDDPNNAPEDFSQGWSIFYGKKTPAAASDKLHQEPQKALGSAPGNIFALGGSGKQKEVDPYSNPFANLQWDFEGLTKTSRGQDDVAKAPAANDVDKVSQNASNTSQSTPKTCSAPPDNLERDQQEIPTSSRGSFDSSLDDTKEAEQTPSTDAATIEDCGPNITEEQGNNVLAAPAASPVTRRDSSALDTAALPTTPKVPCEPTHAHNKVLAPPYQWVRVPAVATPLPEKEEAPKEDPTNKVATQEDIDRFFEKCKKKDKKRARKARKQAAATVAEKVPKQPSTSKPRATPASTTVAVLEKPEAVLPRSPTHPDADAWSEVARKGRYTKETSVKGRKVVNATSYLARQGEENEENEVPKAAIQVRFGVNGAKHDAKRVVPRYVVE